MKTRALFRKLIYSTWFLASLPTVLIIILFHPVGSKYNIEIEPLIKKSGNYIYDDLNSDSTSELIVTGKVSPFYFIAVWNIDHQIYDEWNLADSINPSSPGVFFGNYDHDRYREIYVFTYHKDSLFLNVNEILDPEGTKMNRIFITKVGYLKGEVAAAVNPAGFFDENGDGRDELYFSISSYFMLGTRRMYYYDFVNRTLKSSQFCGSICLEPEMSDTDNDGRPEIFGFMSASGNYQLTTPYSDSSTWLMVFDDRLNFKFPPVEFRGFANSLSILPYRNGKFIGYLLSHKAGGTDTTVLKSGIMIYTNKGKLVKYRGYAEFVQSGTPVVYTIRAPLSDRIYVLSDKFYELNDSLQVINQTSIPFSSPVSSYKADLNGDGEEEFLLYSEEEKKWQYITSR